MYHHFVVPNFLMEKCSEMKYQMSTLYKYAEQKFDDDDDDDDGDDQEELNGNAQEWLSNGLFALHIRFPVIRDSQWISNIEHSHKDGAFCMCEGYFSLSMNHWLWSQKMDLGMTATISKDKIKRHNLVMIGYKRADESIITDTESKSDT